MTTAAAPRPTAYRRRRALVAAAAALGACLVGIVHTPETVPVAWRPAAVAGAATTATTGPADRF